MRIIKLLVSLALLACLAGCFSFKVGSGSHVYKYEGEKESIEAMEKRVDALEKEVDRMAEF